jgi:hypothetical protein
MSYGPSALSIVDDGMGESVSLGEIACETGDGAGIGCGV